MKKIATLLLVLLFITSLISAQSSKICIGLLGGASVNNSELYQYGYGYSSMLQVDYNISKILSAKIGFGFEKKGTNEKQGWADVNDDPLYTLNIKQDYKFLSAPILVAASFGSNVRFFVNAGPCLNYLFKQSSQEDEEYNFGKYNDNTHLYKKFDVNISVGAGANFPLTSQTFFTTEIRNNWGVNNLHKTVGLQERINTLSLLFGIKYCLK